MHKLSFRNAQENCQWLALAGSFFILASTIALTLLWPAESQALNATNENNLFPLAGDYQSPYRCRECHATEFQAWSGTPHAKASFDPIFQTFLLREERPGECFSCHATGYDYTTGQFVLAGVTCEACHGPYRADHPEKSMTIAASKDLCGTCHTSTLAEWTSSRHGKAGITCTACHEVHTQKTRSPEHTNTLCADCHQDRIQDSTHAIHSKAGIQCIECHVARPSDNASNAMGGNAVTGHVFVVSASTCSQCHPIPFKSQ